MSSPVSIHACQSCRMSFRGASRGVTLHLGFPAEFNEAPCKARASHTPGENRNSHYGGRSKLKFCCDFLGQFDSLLHELFVVSYLLDSSIFRLLFRGVTQSQFSHPRELGKTLRFNFLICLAVNFWPVLRHLWPPVHFVNQGFLLDFIGRCER